MWTSLRKCIGIRNYKWWYKSWNEESNQFSSTPILHWILKTKHCKWPGYTRLVDGSSIDFWDQ